MTETWHEFFWSRVHKSEDPDGCWDWTGAKTMKGFGKIRIPDVGFRAPHRITYEMFVETVPSSSPLTQTCGNKICVQPKHLVLKSEFEGDWSERFWAKVDKTDSCWLWTSYTDPMGYGRFNVKNTPRLAHRLSYRTLVGEIPDGLGLDHLCHTPACVNPDHLRPTTQKQNGENRQGAPKNNKSGYLGVSWSKAMGKWTARVGHEGQPIIVGYFSDVLEAAEAVKAKRLELFTHNDLDR